MTNSASVLAEVLLRPHKCLIKLTLVALRNTIKDKNTKGVEEKILGPVVRKVDSAILVTEHV